MRDVWRELLPVPEVINQQPGVLRILLHYSVLNRGGAERSTLRLLSALVDRGHEVHLVLTMLGGTLEDEVDKRVVIHHLRDCVGSFPRSVRGPKDLLNFFGGAMLWTKGRLQEAWRSRAMRRMRFDAAIAGLHGLSPRFICKKVDASRRFVMVRNDAADDQRGKLAANIRKYQDAIDGYICVSQSVLDSLVFLYPSLKTKAVRIYNLIQPDAMRAVSHGSLNPFTSSGEVLRILSVCRLQESQKELLRMVEVHHRILDAGLRHEWHVLGDGPDRGLLEQAIAAHQVTETFKLHGAVKNPLPYYMHADICAVLSRYEGLCGVVNEARVLERPVIATRFAGIEEQIASGVNGLIVEQDVTAICAGMTALLGDPNLRERLAQGGYPRELLDDDAKLDALIDLLAGAENAPLAAS